MSIYADGIVPLLNPRHSLLRRAVEEGKSVEALLTKALETGGSIAGAARELGVAPNTVRYHMDRLNLVVEKVVGGRVTQRDLGSDQEMDCVNT